MYINKIWQIKYKFKNKIYYDFSSFELRSKNKFIDFWNNKKVFLKGNKIVVGGSKLYKIIEVVLINKIYG